MKELGNRMIILSNGIKHYLHKAAEEEGISGAQSRILHFTAVKGIEGDVYQKDMEDYFCLRRSTVTQTLQTMEKNGLIKRSNVTKDARLKRIELTDEGRAMERRIHKKVEAMERQISGCLTDEEIAIFIKSMDKIDDKMMELLGECPCKKGVKDVKDTNETDQRI